MENAFNELRKLWYSWRTPPVFLYSHMVGVPPGADAVESEAELEALLGRYFVFFSYRKNFPPLLSQSGSVTTDTGWGCLVRSTQMLMAHCLKRYAWHSDPLVLFRDVADTRAAPFSVRALVEHSYARRPFKPEYWTPSQGCEALQAAVSEAVCDGHLPAHVSAVTSVCGTLFAREVQRGLARRCPSAGTATGAAKGELVFAAAAATAATRAAAKGTRRPEPRGANLPSASAPQARPASPSGAVLILLPVRASVRPSMDQETFERVSLLMQLHTCAGIVGGTQNRSFYFLGCCQRQVVYLDPHLEVQPALVDIATPGNVVPTLQYLKAIPFWQLCTSLSMAFVVQSESEWAELRQGLERVPFINVEDGSRPRSLRRLVPNSPNIVPMSDPSSDADSNSSMEWKSI